MQSQSTTIKGKVLAYDPKLNTNTLLDYTDKSIHTEHGKMYRIKTESGFTIDITDDHSLITNGTESLFTEVKPENSLGKFVPIINNVSYTIPEEISEDAYAEAVKRVMDGEDHCFYDSLLEVDDSLLPLVATIVPVSGDKENYTCKDQHELDVAKVVLARLNIPITKIDGLTITIDPDADIYIPNKDGSALIAGAKCREENPSNPYLQLPYTWSKVTEVVEIPREEITYDFSVPAMPMFVGAGILVKDTMQMHVPVSEGARVEALNRMLPSKNLFSPLDGHPMMLPQQEHVFGLYLASKDIPTFTKGTKYQTVSDMDKLFQDIKMGAIKVNDPVEYMGNKTTAGMALVNSLLPMTLRRYQEVWNKKYMTRVLSMIGKSDPAKYAYIADMLKELGSLYAYKMGASYKISDFNLEKLKKKRDAYFNKIDKQLAKVDEDKSLSQEDKDKQKGVLLRKAQDFSMKLTEEEVGNTFNRMAFTGAKGSPGQVMQIMTSPTVVADPKDRLIPSLIHNSYLEGLTPADYWTSGYGTRKGTVGAKLSVAPAGGLSKELVNNTIDLVVSCKNCGTSRGLTREIEDTENVINRVEAGTNKFIDANYYEQLKRSGKQTVIVRSPATCEARDGVCQYCYGFNEKQQFPEIGENIGVVSAQAVSEPLTQLGLSSKHTAGTATDNVAGFPAIKAFYNMSTKFSGAAVITEVSGTISKIENAPAGGTNVYVDKKKYYVPPIRTVKVSIGDIVKAGDPLTDGILNLSKVVPYKGIDEGRKEFIENAATLYDQSGVHSYKKNFEVLSRGLINYVEIKDPGDFDQYVEGDVVDYNQLQADIRKTPFKKAPIFTPIQKGTNKAPAYKGDWMSNFGFKYLKGKLIDNAATFSKSQKHSYHPVGPYARGAGFGNAPDGKY